ncbi:hypothetical protein [Enterococcus sp. DIV1420a]|uniref:hypothetical protein n=1 Tax=Enterococcus sp. DIV1420a TaxID=2774672 RepID=UPI003F1EA25C
MKKRNKIIIVGVIALLIIGGGSYGIYTNVQHQKEVKFAEQHKKKVKKEEKQVNELQKTFDIKKNNAQEVLKNLSDLKLTTNESKKLQEKFVNADKQKFVVLENEIIAGLAISDKDKKFSEISILQANIKVIQNELNKLKGMVSIFTEQQIKGFTDKLNAMLKTENSQINHLQIVEKEKAEKETAAKNQEEAENARLQAQEQADYEAQQAYQQSQGADNNNYSTQNQANNVYAPVQQQAYQQSQGADNNNYSTQNQANNAYAPNQQQATSAPSEGSSGVIPGTNNGVGWASDPSQVPPGAVIQPPK